MNLTETHRDLGEVSYGGIVTVTYRERRGSQGDQETQNAQGSISLDFRSEAEVPCARQAPVLQTGLADRNVF